MTLRFLLPCLALLCLSSAALAFDFESFLNEFKKSSSGLFESPQMTCQRKCEERSSFFIHYRCLTYRTKGTVLYYNCIWMLNYKFYLIVIPAVLLVKLILFAICYGVYRTCRQKRQLPAAGPAGAAMAPTQVSVQSSTNYMRFDKPADGYNYPVQTPANAPPAYYENQGYALPPPSYPQQA